MRPRQAEVISHNKSKATEPVIQSARNTSLYNKVHRKPGLTSIYEINIKAVNKGTNRVLNLSSLKSTQRISFKAVSIKL